MKYLKLNIFLLAFLMSSILTAQDTTNIIGKWLEEDGNAISKYYFFEHEGNLYGLIYSYKDGKEEFSLDKELKEYQIETSSSERSLEIEDLSSEDIFTHFKEFVLFDDLEKVGNTWKGKFRYSEKGKSATYDCKIKSIDKNELNVRFKYWGSWDSSSWKRVENKSPEIK